MSKFYTTNYPFQNQRSDWNKLNNFEFFSIQFKFLEWNVNQKLTCFLILVAHLENPCKYQYLCGQIGIFFWNVICCIHPGETGERETYLLKKVSSLSCFTSCQLLAWSRVYCVCNVGQILISTCFKIIKFVKSFHYWISHAHVSCVCSGV